MRSWGRRQPCVLGWVPRCPGAERGDVDRITMTVREVLDQEEFTAAHSRGGRAAGS